MTMGADLGISSFSNLNDFFGKNIGCKKNQQTIFSIGVNVQYSNI